MRMCAFCKGRNNSNFEECESEECELCRGMSARLDGMIGEAVAKIPKYWKTFAISTGMPAKIMAAEEDTWDYGLGESIKNDFNRRIVEAVAGKTGLEYSPLKADGRIVFDFAKNETRTENSDIFIFGKYKKMRAGLAQSEWACKSCNGKGCGKCGFRGVMYDSVEAVLCEAAKRIYGAKDAELHASGREDVDVVNSAGRAFVLEIREPKEGKKGLGEFRRKVNGANEGVQVLDLRYVTNSEVALVADSHFDKAYEAEIEVEGLEEKDYAKILELNGKILEQRTPWRVAHRRADKVRKRRILDLRIIEEEPLRLRILAEAGTYIKEFINGDEGRTRPSIAEALGKNAKCIKLSVVGIHDEFLNDILGE